MFFRYIKNLAGFYPKKQRKISIRLCEIYQDLSEEEKNKKHQYTRERYRNFFEEEKNKQRENGRERQNNLPEHEKQRISK